jgi:hypothetical protein
MYSLDAVSHGDSIAPKISQIGTVQLELCPSAKERRVLKSVTNKYFLFELIVTWSARAFPVLIRRATAFASRLSWPTILHMKCKAIASIIVSCRHTKGPGSGVSSPYGTV